MFGKKKDPIELLSIAKMGAQAETIQRLMGHHLEAQKDRIVRNIAGAKPDLGNYSFLAGQLHQIFQLTSALELDKAEAKSAVEELRKGSNG